MRSVNDDQIVALLTSIDSELSSIKLFMPDGDIDLGPIRADLAEIGNLLSRTNELLVKLIDLQSPAG